MTVNLSLDLKNVMIFWTPLEIPMTTTFSNTQPINNLVGQCSAVQSVEYNGIFKSKHRQVLAYENKSQLKVNKLK